MKSTAGAYWAMRGTALAMDSKWIATPTGWFGSAALICWATELTYVHMVLTPGVALVVPYSMLSPRTLRRGRRKRSRVVEKSTRDGTLG